MIVPAQRLYLLLLLGGLLAMPLTMATTLNIGGIFLVIYDSILLISAVIDFGQVKANSIKISRLPLHRLSVGRDNPVEFSLRSKQQAARVIISDEYPVTFAVSVTHLEALLAPKTPQTLTYTVHPHQRGEFDWGNIQVRQLGQWGLAWRQWTVTGGQKVAIYPDLMGLHDLSARLTLENTGTMRQARRIGMGTEFAELREYYQGDDLRFVDWKATARRDRPFVRVLEPDREQTLIILLDRGRLMTSRVQGLTRFDWGLNATLSLALTGLHRGDRVGVGVFDKEVIAWLPPERGQSHLSRLVERLTPLQPVLLEPDYVGAVSTLISQQVRRALVVLITDIVDATASAELLAAMVRLTPRYLPFCVALRDPQVDRIANEPTETIETTYQRAVALDLLRDRQVAFAKLKQQGVLVLDAPANSITQELVDRYLQIKARTLL